MTTRWLLIGIATLAAACGDDTDTRSSGGGGGSGGAGGTGAQSSGGSGGCPGECFAAAECVTTCGDTPENFGCCGCPVGMVDVSTCDSGCGLVGSPCPGATDCGGGLSCTGSVCAPAAAMCAPPPDGVGCGAGTECLVVTGTDAGICVTAAERVCLCSGEGTFDCTP